MSNQRGNGAAPDTIADETDAQPKTVSAAHVKVEIAQIEAHRDGGCSVRGVTVTGDDGPVVSAVIGLLRQCGVQASPPVGRIRT